MFAVDQFKAWGAIKDGYLIIFCNASKYQTYTQSI